VMKPACRPRRKAAASATSSGVPKRPAAEILRTVSVGVHGVAHLLVEGTRRERQALVVGVRTWRARRKKAEDAPLGREKGVRAAYQEYCGEFLGLARNALWDTQQRRLPHSSLGATGNLLSCPGQGRMLMGHGPRFRVIVAPG
jgi:hypothetical protein